MLNSNFDDLQGRLVVGQGLSTAQGLQQIQEDVHTLVNQMARSNIQTNQTTIPLHPPAPPTFVSNFNSPLRPALLVF